MAGSKNKNQKTCYIYTRVSTAMQVDGYSLEAVKCILKTSCVIVHRNDKMLQFHQR